MNREKVPANELCELRSRCAALAAASGILPVEHDELPCHNCLIGLQIGYDGLRVLKNISVLPDRTAYRVCADRHYVGDAV